MTSYGLSDQYMKDTNVFCDNSIFSVKMRKAIQFSLKTHEIYQKQKRKGKDIPYITHPLTVGLILARAGAAEDIIIAGILHDTMEDSITEHRVTRLMLNERFGLFVGAIVESMTEPNKNLPWKERKQAALERIKTMEGPSILVKSADIISNVSEILDDYEHDGEILFSRFNASKKDVIANYQAVINALIKWRGQFENPLIPDLKIFVDGLAKLA